MIKEKFVLLSSLPRGSTFRMNLDCKGYQIVRIIQDEREAECVRLTDSQKIYLPTKGTQVLVDPAQEKEVGP